jgi:hypothetical protein
MAVGAIWMSALLPAWRQQVQRQREEELIFIGEQYAKSIVLYQMKNQGAFPPNIEALVSGHYLRKQWKDPITGEDFMVIGPAMAPQGPQTPGRSTGPAPSGPQQPGRGGVPAGGVPGGQVMAGVSGVRSRSTATSIKIYKNLQQHSLWPFDAPQFYQYMNYQPGGRGGPGRGGPQAPGQPGRGGPGQGGPGQGGPGTGRGGDGRGAPATPLPPGRGGRGG